MCQTINRTIGRASRETSMSRIYLARTPIPPLVSQAGRALAGRGGRERERASRARGARDKDGGRETVKPSTPRAASQSQHRARAVNAIVRCVASQQLESSSEGFSLHVGSTKRPDAATSENAITKCTLEYASGQERVYSVTSRRIAIAQSRLGLRLGDVACPVVHRDTRARPLCATVNFVFSWWTKTRRVRGLMA